MQSRHDRNGHPSQENSQYDHELPVATSEDEPVAQLNEQWTANPVTAAQPSNSDSGSNVLHVRTTIPLRWAIALEHVIADLRLTKAEALRESVALFLRFHGHSAGIPAPIAPLPHKKEISR
jgi:hypothetical protein